MWFTREGLEQASAEPLARHRAARYAGFAGGGRPVLRDRGRPVRARPRAGRPGRGPRPGPPPDGQGERPRPRGRRACGRLRRRRATCACPGRWRCSSTRPGGPAAGACRRGRAARRWPGAWSWRAGSRPSASRPLPASHLGLVPDGWEVELLADRRELKEAVLWSPALATTARRATVFPGPHTLTARPGPPVPCAPPGAFLLDPSPAVTRAGLVETLARDLGAWKLDPRIAFLSADQPLRSPFGRLLRGRRLPPLEPQAPAPGAARARRRHRRGPQARLRRRRRRPHHPAAPARRRRRRGRPDPGRRPPLGAGLHRGAVACPDEEDGTHERAGTGHRRHRRPGRRLPRSARLPPPTPALSLGVPWGQPRSASGSSASSTSATARPRCRRWGRPGPSRCSPTCCSTARRPSPASAWPSCSGPTPASPRPGPTCATCCTSCGAPCPTPTGTWR